MLHLDRRAANLAHVVANQPGDHLLTAEELAAWLAISVPTIKRWRATGDGPRVTVLGPKRIRYRKQDVLDWLESRSMVWAERG